MREGFCCKKMGRSNELTFVKKIVTLEMGFVWVSQEC